MLLKNNVGLKNDCTAKRNTVVGQFFNPANTKMVGSFHSKPLPCYFIANETKESGKMSSVVSGGL